MRHTDYADLVKKVVSTGARFVNNSWNVQSLYDEGSYGTVPGTGYTLYSKAADHLVRDAYGDVGELGEETHREATLVFSAGNLKRPSHEDPWPVGWVLSPANAKNVIAAGASRGWYEPAAGSPHPDCATWVTDDPHYVGDIAGGEKVPDSHNPPSYHHSWHSRRAYLEEPGGGGSLPRFKPDLVAPGTYAATALSRRILNPETDHTCFGGTSATAPAVAASAVLAEAWYYHRIGGALPSPAMIRAVLVAHAEDLSGGTDFFPPGLPPQSPSTLPHSPSIAQGWGRVNLDGLLQDETPVVALDQDHASAGRRFTASGQWWSTQLEVADPGRDVLAVMVFTDAPSEPAAADLTVNDLDLRLFKRGQWANMTHLYWSNHFAASSWYSRNTAGLILPSLPEDRHNTVEVVRVPAGQLTGTFVVGVKATTVVAKSVPWLDGGETNPNQDFALYVFNASLVEE